MLVTRETKNMHLKIDFKISPKKLKYALKNWEYTLKNYENEEKCLKKC